jgi:pSer/pThr/pTyr-binding forkhead associated (FHA) protein
LTRSQSGISVSRMARGEESVQQQVRRGEDLDPHGLSPAEVRARLEASRTGRPRLILRDDRHQQRIVMLDAARQMTLGRDPHVDVALSWDQRVSGVHATLECIGGTWTIADDGLSRNGTFCNHERVRGRRRLADGDTLRLGHTAIVFRDAGVGARAQTIGTGPLVTAKLSDTQRQVLVALCRPYGSGGRFTVPATNHDIAAELGLGVDAVKAHLRVLFEKFGIQKLPQNQKRGRLAELAFLSGVITERDLT